MKACHILLGRPWQFGRKTLHHGNSNEITLQHHSITFVFHPLSPSQLASDQVQMRSRREEDSSKNSKASKDSKDRTKVKEVSSSKDVAHEVLLTHKILLHTLHNEQPPFLLLCDEGLCCFLLRLLNMV